MFFFVLLKAFIDYKIFDKPEYLKHCIEVDYECINYCEGVSDVSYLGIKNNCDDRDCCVEYDHAEASFAEFIRSDLKFKMLITLGIGIAFSAFITDYVTKKNDKN